MSTFESHPGSYEVEAAVLDRPPQLDDAKIAHIERLVNELDPEQLAALHESIGPELERIDAMPAPRSQIEEVGLNDVFTAEERAEAELIDSQQNEAEKTSSWWKTSLKVIGYGGLIAAGIAAGHYLGAGSMLWNAITKAGPALAELAAEGAELATAGYEAMADGVVSLAEGGKEILQNMGILSDVGGEAAEIAGEGAQQAAEALQGTEGLGRAAEGLLDNAPGIDDLKEIIPDNQLPPMPGGSPQ